jgi:hypothetical protein
MSSGLLRHVVWKTFTDVPEVSAALVIRAMAADRPDDGGGKHL